MIASFSFFIFVINKYIKSFLGLHIQLEFYESLHNADDKSL